MSFPGADMDGMSSNSTEWMICHNMEKCNPPKTISDLNDIICDGVYDCFGGFDESSCEPMSQENVNGDDFCGAVADEDEEVTDRSKIVSRMVVIFQYCLSSIMLESKVTVVLILYGIYSPLRLTWPSKGTAL